MFIAKYKSKKIWKYVNRLVIILDLDPWDFSTTAIIKTKTASFFVDITEVEKWLDKKKVYEVGFKQAIKKCFMSIDKSYLATIFELSILEKMFKVLNKKYSATNAARLYQLFCNC